MSMKRKPAVPTTPVTMTNFGPRNLGTLSLAKTRMTVPNPLLTYIIAVVIRISWNRPLAVTIPNWIMLGFPGVSSVINKSSQNVSVAKALGPVLSIPISIPHSFVGQLPVALHGLFPETSAMPQLPNFAMRFAQLYVASGVVTLTYCAVVLSITTLANCQFCFNWTNEVESKAV